jgi:site-specific recombinase XerD
MLSANDNNHLAKSPPSGFGGQAASGGTDEKINNLDLFVNRWRQYQEIINRAPGTILTRGNSLKHLVTFLIQQGVSDIYDVRKEHLSSYQKELFYQLNKKGRQNQPGTLNNQIKAMKSFFSFLKIEGYLSYDPSRDIQYSKEPRALPKVILTEKEIKKLLKAPDIHNPFGYRDRAMLELLYSSGLRLSELLNLKPVDVDYEQGLVRVNKGKGGKDRIVPIGKIASKYVENYIKLIRIDLQRKKNNEYLFLSLQGRQLCGRQLEWLIDRYTYKAKLNKNVTPHTFRHTCATHLLQRKANIRCVQEILGHASLDTTQKYTQITITDLKEAHQSSHPREKDENY